MAERTDTLVSLARAKSLLDMGDDEDTRLSLLIRIASRLVRRECRRNFLRDTFTETRDGPQMRTFLLVKEFPLLSVSSVYDSHDRTYGSEHLIDPENYVLYQYGEIHLVNGLTFRTGVQNVRVTYEAGYEVLRIVAGVNDRIDFKESQGGQEKTATLTAGDYTAEELADRVETQLDAAGGETYTVSYSVTVQKFTISSGGSFLSLLWSSGSNAGRSAGTLLGFAVSADDTGTTSYTADSLVVAMPEDLEAGTALWAGHLLDVVEPGELLEYEKLGDYAYRRGKAERARAPEQVMGLIGSFVRRDRSF